MSGGDPAARAPGGPARASTRRGLRVFLTLLLCASLLAGTTIAAGFRNARE